MLHPNRSFPWLPVGGVLLALVVIWFVRNETRQAERSLQATFTRQAELEATEAALAQTQAALAPRPQVRLDDLRLPSLPDLGIGPAQEPIVSGAMAQIRIDVLELAPTLDGVSVRGSVTNTSQGEITVPISAFTLRDSAGAIYEVGTDAKARLRPGEGTPLELMVPVPDGRGLVLVVQMPGEAPLELRLRDETLEPRTPA